MIKKFLTPVFLVFLIGTILRLSFAWLFPITQDEAYYFYWSRFLDLGYFDHPPMIAWLGSLGNSLPNTPVASRWWGFLLTTAMFPLFISLARLYGLNKEKSLLVAALLFQFNLASILLGFIQTPDLPLAFFWLLALHEAAYALEVDPKRWLTAGIATGLGLSSKYTMLLIGLVFLWAILNKRRTIFTPWPYLGGLCCVIAFLPHLTWNYTQDWVSFRFQFGRGFKSEYVVAGAQTNRLPIAQRALDGGEEYRYGEVFSEPKKIKPPKPKPPVWVQKLQKITNYFGGQLALWGFLVFPLLLGLRKWRQIQSHQRDYSLLLAATIVPVLIFGLLSPFQKIEANWPAVYVLSGSILLAILPISFRVVMMSCSINIALVVALLIHSYSPLTTKNPAKDRILRETHGYQALSSYLSQLQYPILGDTYQKISLISYYSPELQISQWPGIARMSELSRRKEMIYHQLADLKRAGGFYLVTSNQIPPFLPGFRIKSYQHLRDCLHGKLEVYEERSEKFLDDRCEKPVHRWYLAFYVSSESSPVSSM